MRDVPPQMQNYLLHIICVSISMSIIFLLASCRHVRFHTCCLIERSLFTERLLVQYMDSLLPQTERENALHQKSSSEEERCLKYHSHSHLWGIFKTCSLLVHFCRMCLLLISLSSEWINGWIIASVTKIHLFFTSVSEARDPKWEASSAKRRRDTT